MFSFLFCFFPNYFTNTEKNQSIDKINNNFYWLLSFNITNLPLMVSNNINSSMTQTKILFLNLEQCCHYMLGDAQNVTETDWHQVVAN